MVRKEFNCCHLTPSCSTLLETKQRHWGPAAALSPGRPRRGLGWRWRPTPAAAVGQSRPPPPQGWLPARRARPRRTRGTVAARNGRRRPGHGVVSRGCVGETNANPNFHNSFLLFFTTSTTQWRFPKLFQKRNMKPNMPGCFECKDSYGNTLFCDFYGLCCTPLQCEERDGWFFDVTVKQTMGER